VLLTILLLDLDVAQRVSGLVLLGRQEEAGTLTGRLPLWEELSGYAAQRPLVGYGYGGFWNVERTRSISENQGWQIAHSHSAYFETQLNLGAVGLLLACAAGVIASVKAAWRFWTTGDPGWGFFCGLFAFAGFYSLTDAGFALPGFMTLVFYAALAHTLCWREPALAADRHVSPALGRSAAAEAERLKEAIA
jgi:O-antigen ligase